MGYELHPRTPPGGIPLAEYLRAPAEMLGYVKSFAAGFGIRDLVPPLRLASTRRARAAAERARDAGTRTRRAPLGVSEPHAPLAPQRPTTPT